MFVGDAFLRLPAGAIRPMSGCMNPLAWLASLIFPACGAIGALGLPVPPPMDMAAIVRPSTPNTTLAGPAGFAPTPDIATPPFAMPPAKLYAAIQAVAAAQPLTFPAARYDDRMQAHYVVRSALLNYPDLMTVSVSGPDPGPSTLVLYSRSVYGRSDLGANRARAEAWLAALAIALAK
jgi:uncharacterized protein (DUF1499 family)